MEEGLQSAALTEATAGLTQAATDFIAGNNAINIIMNIFEGKFALYLPLSCPQAVSAVWPALLLVPLWILSASDSSRLDNFKPCLQ